MLRYRARPAIYHSVWSQNGFDGESYEYKVNCFTDSSVLGTCYLWGLTAVRVEAPDGRIFDLENDFNIQSYSAEAGPVATDYRDRYEALTGRSLRRCPRCHDGNMQAVDHLAGAWGCPVILDSS